MADGLSIIHNSPGPLVMRLCALANYLSLNACPPRGEGDASGKGPIASRSILHPSPHQAGQGGSAPRPRSPPAPPTCPRPGAPVPAG